MSEKTPAEIWTEQIAEIKKIRKVSANEVAALTIAQIVVKSEAETWSNDKLSSALLLKIAQFLEK